MELPDSLRCLRKPNLRLFFGGQTVSLVGTWMQSVALQWLVWRLTHSPAALGTVAFLGSFPVALLGTLGGSVADRVHRRTVVFTTQALAAAQATALAALALSGRARADNIWLVYGLSAALGAIYAFDIPARQALLADMGEDDMGNAIALNSSVVNGARLVGPALAGLVVAAIGEGPCFLLNALSYLGILWSLTRMQFPPQHGARPGKGHFVEGLRYAATTPHVRALLGTLLSSSVFGLAYSALAPVFAAQLGGGARLLGVLLASAGLGALVGAASLLGRHGLAGLGRRVAWGSSGFGAGLLLLAAADRAWLACLALLLAGWGFMLQLASTNTLLQSLAPAAMRGRVMGIFSTVFVGLSPLGALGAGLAAARFGARPVVAACALVVLATSGLFFAGLPRLRRIVLRDFPEQFEPARAG